MDRADLTAGGAQSGGAGADEMATSLKTAAESYLRAKALSRGTRNEYLSTLRKWERWGGGIPVEQLRRKDIREFLDWVYEQAVTEEGGVKTDKAFYRPMNRVVHAHLRSLTPEDPRPDAPVFLGGGAR